VQCTQKTPAARHRPAQQNPTAPKQVQEQDGFRENRCYKNGTSTSLCWLLLSDIGLPCVKMKRRETQSFILHRAALFAYSIKAKVSTRVASSVTRHL
jgi:hypothetical protein